MRGWVSSPPTPLPTGWVEKGVSFSQQAKTVALPSLANFPQIGRRASITRVRPSDRPPFFPDTDKTQPANEREWPQNGVTKGLEGEGEVFETFTGSWDPLWSLKPPPLPPPSDGRAGLSISPWLQCSKL